jgi:hypothetical protein
MSLELNGKITEITPVETITSKAGKEYKKMGFVIDTSDQFNPFTFFGLFGDEKVDNFIKYNKVGQSVTVSFNVSSKEHNGKWYTQADAWMIKNQDASTPSSPTDYTAKATPPAFAGEAGDENLDLPF